MIHATEQTDPYDQFDNVPLELKATPQWVVWRYEDRGKPKPDKVPYNPRAGQRAKSNDLQTWASFAEAAAAFQHGGFDGVGFVFSAADPYSGVDLDSCRDPETGRLEPWAGEIVERLDSYTEASPSGTGVHIFVKGKLPPWGRKKGHVEMYDSGQFFTVTGEHIGGTPATIGDRIAELAALHAEVFGKSEKEAPENGVRSNGAAEERATPLSDEETVILAKQAKDREKFTHLWTGDTTGYPSPSEADLALCTILAFYCGPDPTRIDRLFRQSELYRQKWNEKHFSDGRTYGEATIAKSLAGAREFYSASGTLEPPWPGDEDAPPEDLSPEQKAQSNSLTLTRLSDVVPSAVRWLWPGRIPLGKVSVLDGDPGLGKSLQTLDIAARVSTARAMPDGSASDLHDPAGVVILSAEDDLGDTIRPRLEAAGADLSRVVALTAVRDEDDTRLPTLADLEQIRQAIVEVDARLLIIDPLMAYLPDKVDSHRDQDIRRSLAPLAVLAAETGIAALVIRHLNKTEGKNALYRGGGSIGIIGAARSGLLVAKDPEDPDGERRILVSTKSNLAKLPPALAYRVVAPNGVPFIAWQGTTHHTAASLLAQQAEGEDRSALEEAMTFLRESLTDGPRPSREVQREAEQAGVNAITLRRARTALGIKPAKTGRPGDEKQQWQWSLPPKLLKSVEDAHKKSMSTFGRNEHLREAEDSEVL